MSYTKERAISDYKSELENLLIQKSKGVKEVSIEIYDFIGLHSDKEQELISIDTIINDVKDIINKLENDEIDPEEVNY